MWANGHSPLEKATGNHSSITPTTLMEMTDAPINEGGASGSSSESGAVPGRGGSRASQVIIKRNPYEGTLRLGTWNVRSMTRPETLEALKREMIRYKVNILGLTEMRWLGAGDTISDEFRILYSGGKARQRGVGIILDNATSRCVKEVVYVNDRLIMVRLNGDPVDIMVICVYMPTSDYDDEDVEKVYDEIEELMNKGKGREYVAIVGDWNAVVGEGREEKAVGPYGLGSRNERGSILADFCKRKQLSIMNTWFQLPSRRRYTWKAPGDQRQYQLDYILIKHRYRNSVKNTVTYPGADVFSDHNMLVASIRLRLKRPRVAKRQAKWECRRLMNPEVRASFNNAIAVRNQEGPSNTNSQWENLKAAMKDSADKHIGKTTGRAPKKPWVTMDMVRRMEERRQWKNINTQEGQKEYRRLNNLLRRETDRAKAEWLERQCEELESLEQRGEMDILYQKVKAMANGPRNGPGVNAITSRNGELLTDGEAVMERWREYVQELYARRERPETLPIEAEPVDGDQVGPAVLESEVLMAIKRLREGKAVGPDDIPA